MDARPDDVLAYWFGDTPWQHAPMWFEAGRSLDAEIQQRWGTTVESALAGALDDWASTTQGALALLIVLDQFTRHVYRDDPRFVAGDEKAGRLALGLFDAEGLRSDQKLFAVVALEHQEDPAMQQRAVAVARRLADDHPAEHGPLLPFVMEHHDIIERFGRFPDRNQILGRSSTPEEQAFLASTTYAWFEQQRPDQRD